MEFKGTKGKAKVFNECFKNKYDFYAQPISISSSDKILFANAYGETKEQAEANAKLIASAPEMLEFIIKMQEHYKKDGHLLNVNAGRIESLIKQATE